MEDISAAAAQKRSENQARKDEEMAAKDAVEERRKEGEALIAALDAAEHAELEDDPEAAMEINGEDHNEGFMATGSGEPAGEDEGESGGGNGRKRTRSVAERSDFYYRL